MQYFLCRRVGAGAANPLAACSIKRKQVKRNPTVVSSLRAAAVDHLKFVKDATVFLWNTVLDMVSFAWYQRIESHGN